MGGAFMSDRCMRCGHESTRCAWGFPDPRSAGPPSLAVERKLYAKYMARKPLIVREAARILVTPVGGVAEADPKRRQQRGGAGAREG